MHRNWGSVARMAKKLHVSPSLVRAVLYGQRRNKRVRRALIYKGADFLKHNPTIMCPEKAGDA